MSAIRYKLRGDLRKRWPTWLGIALQASAVTLVAAAIAMPLGAAAGRSLWRLFARNLGVVPEPVTPVLVLILVVPAAIVLANVVAIGPGSLAARIRPATALREQ